MNQKPLNLCIQCNLMGCHRKNRNTPFRINVKHRARFITSYTNAGILLPTNTILIMPGAYAWCRLEIKSRCGMRTQICSNPNPPLMRPHAVTPNAKRFAMMVSNNSLRTIHNSKLFRVVNLPDVRRNLNCKVGPKKQMASQPNAITQQIQ